jgi:cell division protein FtsB
MPLVPEPKSSLGKPARGVEPLRRRRVQPEPLTSPRRRKILNVLLGFATVVLLVDALVGEKGLMERMRARRHLQEQAAVVDALKSENARLRESARRLRDDPSAIEAVAREELGLIKPGEMLFILRDVKPASRDIKSVARPQR